MARPYLLNSSASGSVSLTASLCSLLLLATLVSLLKLLLTTLSLLVESSLLVFSNGGIESFSSNAIAETKSVGVVASGTATANATLSSLLVGAASSLLHLLLELTTLSLLLLVSSLIHIETAGSVIVATSILLLDSLIPHFLLNSTTLSSTLVGIGISPEATSGIVALVSWA